MNEHHCEVRIAESIADIGAEHWNAAACPAAGPPYNPFLDFRFLDALERSGSVGRDAGWQPFHAEVRDRDGCVGFVPMYVKNHSQGEYVFDYAWADAYQRAGGQYYPKLQVSVPFTPATGPRLLTHPDRDPDTAEPILLEAVAAFAAQIGVSSAHMTFMTQAQWERAGAAGWLRRMDQQYHWHNRGYASFDEFLGELASKKRKNLKRERRDALEHGIEIEWVTGSDLREAHWDAFYRFYLDTGSRKWGSPYLNRKFFSLVSEAMPERILLILCRRAGRYIAGALNFIGAEVLFGRNWGCIEDHRFLHFETCYYQAIDFAIAHGLRRVEAGAQGQHKVARGYLPEPTHSAHWIVDAGFRRAVRDYLEDEREYVAADIDETERATPFRADIDLTQLRARAASAGD